MTPPVLVLYVFYLFIVKIETLDNVSNLRRKEPKHEVSVDISLRYFVDKNN